MRILLGMIKETFRNGNYKTSVNVLKQMKNFKFGVLKTNLQTYKVRKTF